jgi:DNA-binding MarR family transcriptional regulator
MDYHPLQMLLIEAMQLTRAVSAVHRKVVIDGLPWESVMILRYVFSNGPLTVSELSRRHKVSRQYMAGLVDDFSKHGYVSLVDNPRHKRSKLVELTDQGKDVVRRTDERGQRACKKLERYLDVDQFAAVTETLRRIRGIVESRKNVSEVDNDQ